MTAPSEIEQQRIRAAKNQSLFRELNERIEELGPSALFAEFICECLQKESTEKVSLTAAEYEEIRLHPNRFFVLLEEIQMLLYRLPLH